MSQHSETQTTEELIHLRVSATLLIKHVLVTEPDDCTEFHVDCLALGLCHDLLPLEIYYPASDPDEIARMRELLRKGNLVVVRNQDLGVCGGSLRFLAPELHPFEGDEQRVRQEFLNQIKLRDQDSGKPSIVREDHLCGRVTKCQILTTKKYNAMAFALVETELGSFEAVLPPQIYNLYQPIVTQLG